MFFATLFFVPLDTVRALNTLYIDSSKPTEANYMVRSYFGHLSLADLIILAHPGASCLPSVLCFQQNHPSHCQFP